MSYVSALRHQPHTRLLAGPSTPSFRIPTPRIASRRTVRLLLVAATCSLSVAGCSLFGGDDGDGPDDALQALRQATAPYQDVAMAQAAGYHLVDGLDHCFANEPVGAMGFHYIDTTHLDLTLDPLHPEAMVYAPQADGTLTLGAVEFIVPAEAWDSAGHSEPPMLFDRHLHLNPALGVYVLHAWIWLDNDRGVFEDWNPDVTCP